MHYRGFILWLLCLFTVLPSFGQDNDKESGFFAPSTELNKKRLHGVIVSESVLYTATMGGLYNIWYRGYERSSFKLYNDNREWLFMDKIGHATTTFYIGKAGYKVLRWTGLDEKRSIWYGGTLGWALMATVEVFDGLSAAWGFSLGDMAANTFGTGLFISQQLAWEDQRILMKFSYHKSPYINYRPEVLGSNLHENLLKDYNGQTYWLSGNIRSFIKNKDSRFPKWLNLALGYGAEGMTGGHYNPAFNAKGELIPEFKRRRQYYLSLDIDLTRVKTRSKLLNTIFGTVGFIKFPMPTLELDMENGIKLYPLYF